MRRCHSSSRPAGSFSLPGTLLALLGWTIESEYHVRRDEGSGFFKSVPRKTNGRDTTGLGPKAWMLGGFSLYRRQTVPYSVFGIPGPLEGKNSVLSGLPTILPEPIRGGSYAVTTFEFLAWSITLE